jgi:UDP-2,3-diacylglucosamine pyrophosphatase LpxH
MASKFKIVVSDLHLSGGHVAEGNPLEDFNRDQDFAAFLDGIAAESDRKDAEVELIVNGDAFEMLQVPHEETFEPPFVYRAEQYHSSSEPDSERKMALIIDGHRPFFEALGRFVRSGPPHRYVTFIKGNHDVNLHWLGVQRRIREAAGTTGPRASLLSFEERRIVREGIYVEHGNQYAQGLDRVEDMEEPHDHDKPGQLALPPGSWFVMDVFNEVEREKYWIDGVKPITALVWYALAYDFRFAARSIAALLRALPGILDEIVFAPEESHAEGLARVLEDPDQVVELAARYETDEEFRAAFNSEVAGLLSPLERPDAVAFAPERVPDAEAKGNQIRTEVNSALFEMAKIRAAEEGVKLVTFGHTHDAVEEKLPDGGLYINSGTWTWVADFSGADKETWRDLFEHPERFTNDSQLNYVRIDYDQAGQPQGRLMTYEPDASPGPEDEAEDSLQSLWDRFVAWLKGLWARIAGKRNELRLRR